jgi:Zn-dependent peptidase ImmA (M78 family)/DNA-binding XRE family transcriptional regulator
MAITKEELARRLRLAREAAGLTQEEAAAEVGLSRGAIGQFETAVKAPSSLHLVRLADLYRRDIGELLAEEFHANRVDGLAALFRADVQLAGDRERGRAVSECAKLCREYTSLETLLGVDQDRIYPPEYGAPPMRSRWEAIRQGERLADLERARLKLGSDPIGDVTEILEEQGVRFVELPLPENISGLCLLDGKYGLSVFVNSDHHPRRQFFSCAHEYCHLLADRGQGSLVSRVENREELVEVRANAFAAAFVMPEDGVRAFVRRLGKGEASRSQLRAYDEEGQAVTGQKRMEGHSQDLQAYDVAHLAHHFGVSYEMALYRVLNLKLVSEEERVQLAAQKDTANAVMRMLGPELHARGSGREPFRHQFVLLGLEALRREVISRRKFYELCALAQIPISEVEELTATVESESETGPRDLDVRIPTV